MKDLLKDLDDNTFKLLEDACGMADSASEELIKNFRKDMPEERGTVKEVKSIYDIVSDKIIREILESKYPAHSYVTEETGYINRNSEYLWIIDPLDGTGNFSSHNPLFSVSIALWKNGLPLIGLIDAPMMKERFIAVKQYGSFHLDFLRNINRKVSVSDIKESENAYGVYCEGGVTDKNRSLRIMGNYYMQLKDVRKLGSAALELAFVGTGRSECYMTTGISLWDIAAGILFVTEAGGRILHFNGTEYEWSEFTVNSEFDLLATNGAVGIELETK